MHDRLKVPLAFTWEIYGDNEAHFNDCFRMFNPVTPESFDRVRTLLPSKVPASSTALFFQRCRMLMYNVKVHWKDTP